MKNILVTGGAGFIGSNFINYILDKRDDYTIVNLDKLTYAGNLENLIQSEGKKNYNFVRGDICNAELVDFIFKKYDIKYVINFAAESHVDRSILGSEIFFASNVIGTNVLLEASRRYEVEKFLQVSTDEVYGSLGETGLFTEATPLHPNSPYSSSKAAADMMALSFNHTYGLPVVITRCSNNYGPYQFPEKLIPLMIINSLNNKKLPVYGDGMNIRDWIYVIDHNKAVEKVFEDGKAGEVYNVGASTEKPNIEIIKLILKELKKDDSLIEFVKDRPGHDKRYAIENKNWWERIISGEYLKYYQTQYGSV